MMDRDTVRKHVEFYSKNKFDDLAHLVGFIIRMYRDARSCECKIYLWILWKLSTSRHGVTTQKNIIFNNTAGKLEYRYKNHCFHSHYYLRSRAAQRLWPLSCAFQHSVQIKGVPYLVI